MNLTVLTETFSICKLKDYTKVDLGRPFVFTGSTDEERSLVCPTPIVPTDTLERSDGWRAFRIEGELDFSLVGILAGISEVLAKAGIGIFTVSTFNTDYILIKDDRFDEALHVLEQTGHIIKR